MMLAPDSFPGPRAFARHVLRHGIPWMPLSGLKFDPLHGVAECIVFRESCWQIVIVTMPCNLTAPRHRHLRVSSADLCLGAGDSVCSINGQIRTNAVRGPLEANLLLLPRGTWHEGSSGPGGAMFLSFQHWIGEPGYLCEDWEQ